MQGLGLELCKFDYINAAYWRAGDLRRFTRDLRPARFPGDRVVPGSLQQLFGGVYFNDPDGNSNEVYFEDIEAFRRRPEEGEYHRQLVGVSS